jgi:ParB-like chromosome segregation protein Spo0J
MTNIDYNNLEAHPLATLLPMIVGPEFEQLKADIGKQGILVKIKLYGGKPDGTTGPLRILDGRNRFKAASEAGVKLTADHFETFQGTYAEAEAYVLSTNFHRRHLTNAQKQEVILALIEKYPKQSARQIGRICGLSHTAVNAVKEKLKNPPELVKFNEWKKTWDELPDGQRVSFVKEFAADIREMLEA